MDYKSTLNMPLTAFEMKGNLPQKEPAFVERWQSNDYYEKLLVAHQGQPSFVLHDGPPYANGNLHAGTAMNRIIKDMIVKSKAMSGYYTPFFPGWDTHGLPIENAIQKLGHNRKQMSVADFRDLCTTYALEQIEVQKATMKRLGTLADYKNPYVTLNKEFEARQIRTFAKMAMNGLIFQGLKPVYWSPFSETACADSEIVYFDKKDPAIYVAFDVVDGRGLVDGCRFVIWTTTPWTIPANLAICLNPRLDYAVVQTEKGKLVMLQQHALKLCAEFGLTGEIVASYRGSALEQATARHPLYEDKLSLVILGDHVTDEDGTGCVHTAPGHGADDFYIGQKYGLPAYCPVDEKGCMMSEAGDWLVGLTVEEASKAVVKRLDELGNLLKLEFITHSYPHDERLKKPVIFRATVQWFASIEKVRTNLLDSINEVKWENEWGEGRLYNMIKDRGDWCISRQRVWGVPIPIIYDEAHQPIIESEVFEHIAKLFETHGSNVWFEKAAVELLPAGYTNAGSPNGVFTKETDIMDVWFDSGSSHNELKVRGLDYPCDLYFEGSDQYRGWFNSSLIVGVATNGQAPYKSVLSHGYVNDAKGQKMSKSIGNVVNPMDIIKVYGADVLRLWCGTIDFKQDVRIGDDNLKQVAEQYRKVRNTFRFMLGNINKNDFNPVVDLVDYKDLQPADQFIMVMLHQVNEKVQLFYKSYDFLSASSVLSNFMSSTLSSFYLDFAKDILYIDKADGQRRRQVQTVIYHCVNTLVRLWAPTLSFTMEEVWDDFGLALAESVHLVEFVPVVHYDNGSELISKFERFLMIKDDVYKALEEARAAKLIGKSLEAKVLLNIPTEDQSLLTSLFDNIPQVFIVSAVEFVNRELMMYQVAQVGVELAPGVTCPRCWNVTEVHGDDGLCQRCQAVVHG